MWSPRIFAEQQNAHKLFSHYRRGSGILTEDNSHLYLPLGQPRDMEMARWDPGNEDREPELENMDFKGLSGDKRYPISIPDVLKQAIDQNPNVV